MGEFGKTFKTLKKANTHAKNLNTNGQVYGEVQVRRLSKKLFPRHTKRFHVGTYLDWLNYA